MRNLAIAAVVGAVLAAGAVAYAEQWTDPNGRLTFNTPAGWQVQPQNATGQTVVLAFNPSSDCYFFGIPNPSSANSSANAVHNTTDPLAPDAWVTAARPVRDFFQDAQPELVSQSVDTSGFWPVQRAELRGPSKTVYGAILIRPGVEIRAFCAGANSASAYSPIFGSLGHPNDATWQAAATEQAAQRQAQQEAAEAAAAAAAQQQSEQSQRRRRN